MPRTAPPRRTRRLGRMESGALLAARARKSSSAGTILTRIAHAGVVRRVARRAAGCAAARGSAGGRSAGRVRARRGLRRAPRDEIRGRHRHQRQDHHDRPHRPPAAGRRACAPSRPGISVGRWRRWRSTASAPTGSRWKFPPSSCTTLTICARRSARLTNLAPDHLDRYATLEEYYADKDRLYLHATRAVMLGDQRRRSGGGAAGRRAARGATAASGSRREAEAWYDRGTSVCCCSAVTGWCRVTSCPCSAITTSPTRLCASLVAWRAGAPMDGIRGGAPLLPRAAASDGADPRPWTACSGSTIRKATNVASTLVAVQALDRPFVLLLGGRHKGEPYTALAPRRGPAAGPSSPMGNRAIWWPGTWDRCCRSVGRGTDFAGRAGRGAPTGQAGRCGAAFSRLLQLRHVPEL